MAHPKRPITRQKTLAKLRDLRFALASTSEKEAWGSPTFRVKDKMFAMFMDNHHDDVRVAELLDVAYRRIAPKRVLPELDAR